MRTAGGIIGVLASLQLSGCTTYEEWYTADQRWREDQCKTHYSTMDPMLERCLEQARLSYPEHRRAREQQTDR